MSDSKKEIEERVRKSISVAVAEERKKHRKGPEIASEYQIPEDVLRYAADNKIGFDEESLELDRLTRELMEERKLTYVQASEMVNEVAARISRGHSAVKIV